MKDELVILPYLPQQHEGNKSAPSVSHFSIHTSSFILSLHPCFPNVLLENLTNLSGNDIWLF